MGVCVVHARARGGARGEVGVGVGVVAIGAGGVVALSRGQGHRLVGPLKTRRCLPLVW